MKTNYSFNNVSNENIFFEINQNNSNENTINYNLKKNNYKENIKKLFPEQKIFRINSYLFNDEKEKQEIYTKYDCIYRENNNSLYLIINEKVDYSNFTKDKLINILDFSNTINLDFIYILVNKINKQYKKFLHDLLLIGFSPEKKFPDIMIDGNIYKSLKISIKDINQEIEQIDFI